MYTQCPECTIAFKVTADVLKQAAGMVRCGGCQNAFNALLFLSESMPEQTVAKVSAAAVPELTPEVIDSGGGLPRTISAEQSAALLKTLDELAGSDIRIEDTGVEWRVLDEEDAVASAVDDHFEDAPDELQLDEPLQASETPVDEILDSSPDLVDAPEIFEEQVNAIGQTPVDELRFDDNTPLPDDFDLDDESSYVPEVSPQPDFLVVEPATQEPQVEIALSEPEEWTDILDEFEDLGAAFAVSGEQPQPQQEHDEVQDMDTQFALQAEAMGIDLSGIEELDAELEPAENSESIADELDEFDGLEELSESAELEELDELGEAAELEELDAAEAIDEIEGFEKFADDYPEPPEHTDEPDAGAEDADLIEETSHLDQIEVQFEPIVENHTIEQELALLGSEGTDDDAIDYQPSNADEVASEHFVPEMTDAEHTVNMQIDQDLMALAIEDDDGFASTIVIPNEDAESKIRSEKTAPAEKYSEMPAGLETIVMEGEEFRSALDGDSAQAEAAAAPKTKLTIPDDSTPDKPPMNIRYGMVAAAAALLVLLAVQMMHQSREALATIPAFNDTVGQLYRVLGQPVQPSYDITGWRFEATKGSTESDDDEALTVYSRIGNNTDSSLPYPLIGISLTDRFEETIGSRMLEPAEYLPTDLDPRKLVEPGTTFDAVITIQSASVDATGFKLNVCYRLSDGQLRCAIDDFK